MEAQEKPAKILGKIFFLLRSRRTELWKSTVLVSQTYTTNGVSRT